MSSQHVDGLAVGLLRYYHSSRLDKLRNKSKKYPTASFLGLAPDRLATAQESRTPATVTQHYYTIFEILKNTLRKCFDFMHLIVWSLQPVFSWLVREPRPITSIVIPLDHQHLTGIAPSPNILYHHKFQHTTYWHYSLTCHNIQQTRRLPHALATISIWRTSHVNVPRSVLNTLY